MPEDFYNSLFRKLTLQIWLATTIMAIVSSLVSITVSRMVSQSEVERLRSSIRYYTSKHAPKEKLIPVEIKPDPLIYKEVSHE